LDFNARRNFFLGHWKKIITRIKTSIPPDFRGPRGRSKPAKYGWHHPHISAFLTKRNQTLPFIFPSFSFPNLTKLTTFNKANNKNLK
jgi:hypothetical protein